MYLRLLLRFLRAQHTPAHFQRVADPPTFSALQCGSKCASMRSTARDFAPCGRQMACGLSLVQRPGIRRVHSLSALIERASASAASKRPMLVQCGFGESGEREGLSLGAARHGRGPRGRTDATSAAVRACRNAMTSPHSPASRIDHYLRCCTRTRIEVARAAATRRALMAEGGHVLGVCSVCARCWCLQIARSWVRWRSGWWCM